MDYRTLPEKTKPQKSKGIGSRRVDPVKLNTQPRETEELRDFYDQQKC